jgi:hypothetical protein
MSETTKISAPDLSQHLPRSPRCALGGYVILPRMFDKSCATITGIHGPVIHCPGLAVLAPFPHLLDPRL